MKPTTEMLFEKFERDNKTLSDKKEPLREAVRLLLHSFREGKKCLVCGNGGSASDAEHIVGELMKGFLKKRPLTENEQAAISKISRNEEEGQYLTKHLQRGLPAISLVSQTSLISAFANDVEPSMVYAQQVLGYGEEGDCFLGLSTSGNSQNVVNGAKIARSRGMKVIGFTGNKDSLLKEESHVILQSPALETYQVQEDHIKFYHLICAAVENEFYDV